MRQAQVAKMGYVRTPDSQVERIAQLLIPSDKEGIIRLLDNCCGEGLALRDLQKKIQAETNEKVLSYGIELDHYRAAQAEEILDHTVCCAYENARTTKGAYSLAWSNPPYDDVAVSDDPQAIRTRKELTFLRGTIDYLAVDGILVYIIPQHRLSETIATTLAWRFENFGVFRFDEEEYEIYKQIVVIAKRKRKSGIKTDAEKAAFRFLRAVGQQAIEIPTLSEAGEQRWVIPPSPEELKNFEFRGAMLDPKELAKDIERSSVWTHVIPALSPVDQKVTGGQPLLPLKTTHLGTIIAAGAVDGVIGTGSDRHMLVGLTRKVLDKNMEEDEEGNVKEFLTERFVSAVKVYTPDGFIKELN